MSTTPARWHPFAELERLWPRDLFSGDFFGRLRPNGELALEWSPRCDVTENDDAVVVHAEIPGVDPNEIEVVIEGAQLIIRGEKRSDRTKEEDGRTYSERFFGTFERAIPIPEGVDPAAIEAKIKDGVIEVRVPRPAVPKPTSTKIPVKSS